MIREPYITSTTLLVYYFLQVFFSCDTVRTGGVLRRHLCIGNIKTIHLLVIEYGY
jgi:hypothetical protein